MHGDSFRAEIREQVAILAQLNRLKIMIVSGLVAVAFGIGTVSSPIRDQSYIVLCLIPFACLYIDAQYYHGLVKIFVLARFLATVPDEIGDLKLVREYERYMDAIRSRYAPKLFSFETKAQLGSTILLGVLGPLLGVPLVLQDRIAENYDDLLISPEAAISILATSSVVGTALAGWQHLTYKRQLLKARTIPASYATNSSESEGEGAAGRT